MFSSLIVVFSFYGGWCNEIGLYKFHVDWTFQFAVAAPLTLFIGLCVALSDNYAKVYGSQDSTTNFHSIDEGFNTNTNFSVFEADQQKNSSEKEFSVIWNQNSSTISNMEWMCEVNSATVSNGSRSEAWQRYRKSLDSD